MALMGTQGFKELGEGVMQRAEYAKQEIAKLKAVTPEQVKEVAQRYLVDDNLTVAVLDPLPIENQPRQNRVAVGGRHGS